MRTNFPRNEKKLRMQVKLDDRRHTKKLFMKPSNCESRRFSSVYGVLFHNFTFETQTCRRISREFHDMAKKKV